ILRFDDQDFSALYRDDFITTSKTGYLQLFKSSQDLETESVRGQVQGPVEVVFTKNDQGKFLINIKENYFSLNPVVFINNP
ncbi:hypothetical protein ABTN16_19740, partial [Acinetobacter baumannii]